MKIKVMKKVLCFVLATVIAMSVTLVASAESATPYDLTSATKRSAISMLDDGVVALVSAFTTTDTSVVQVDIRQSLEKHAYFWTWDNVGGYSFKSVFDNVSNFTNYRTGLASGTYRVKSEFTAYLDDGRTETVVVYSNELTI